MGTARQLETSGAAWSTRRANRRRGLWVALATLWLAVPALALPGGQTLTIAGGGSFPIQPGIMSDLWNTGFVVSGSLLWKAAPVLALGVEVSYIRHPLDTAAFEATIRDQYPNVSTEGHDFWVVPASAIIELDLMQWGVVKPYIRAGFGVYKLGTTDFAASGPGADALEEQVADAELTQRLDDTVFGTLIGLGLRTPITPGIGLTLDATYHVVNTAGESTHFVPVRLGLQF